MHIQVNQHYTSKCFSTSSTKYFLKPMIFKFFFKAMLSNDKNINMCTRNTADFEYQLVRLSLCSQRTPQVPHNVAD